MKLENGQISNTQLLFLVISFLQGMILTINLDYGISKQDTWISVLVGYAIAILFALLYLAIALRFPGKNLVQINDIVFGPYIGKFVSLIYAWYFFQLMIHYMYFFNSFWLTYIMPETPRAVLMVMFMFVCAMAVRKGLEVIARCSFLFSVIVALAVLVTTVLLISNMDPANFLPVFEMSPKVFLQSVHIMLAIPFCDIITFLMIVPYVEKNRQVKKPLLLGITISGAQLLIVTLRDAAVLGPRLPISSSASFAVTRLIDIANVLSRMDILIAIIILISIFIKITVFFYVTVLSFAQILSLRSYKPLVVPIAALAIPVAAAQYPSDMEQVYAAQFVWPFNTIVYQVILPFLTLLVMALRGLLKKEGAK